MKDMKMDKTELGCLRAIVLFNPGQSGLLRLLHTTQNNIFTSCVISLLILVTAESLYWIHEIHVNIFVKCNVGHHNIMASWRDFTVHPCVPNGSVRLD